MTAETHYVNGGLGSIVAEVIAEHGLGCRLIRRGFETVPVGRDRRAAVHALAQRASTRPGSPRSALQALASTEP